MAAIPPLPLQKRRTLYIWLGATNRHSSSLHAMSEVLQLHVRRHQTCRIYIECGSHFGLYVEISLFFWYIPLLQAHARFSFTKRIRYTADVLLAFVLTQKTHMSAWTYKYHHNDHRDYLMALKALHIQFKDQKRRLDSRSVDVVCAVVWLNGVLVRSTGV